MPENRLLPKTLQTINHSCDQKGRERIVPKREALLKMVDRMTALGLASNFVNFADFWIKRFGKAHEIHKSAEALSTNNVSIAKASETTQTFQSRLTINQKSNTGYEDKARELLDGLCSSCYETADELLQIPVALKMQGKKMAWKSMRQAIKII